MTFIIRQKLRAHGSKFTNIKLIEQQGLDEIIEVVTESNLVAAEPVGHGIKNTTTKTRTERTIGRTGASFFFDNLCAIRAFHMHLEPTLSQIVLQNVFAIVRKAGIHIHCDQLVINRGTALQLREDMQQSVRIFTTGHGNGNAVAIFNQFEIANSLAGEPFDFAKVGIIE
jgi:hypothetical protein